jgi:LacI family transcriptional regulator
LHDRPGINSLTRAKVLKMAQTLGYEPNTAARHLRLRKKLRISVHLPRHIASFFSAIREGIEEAARPFHATVELQIRSYPQLGNGDVALFAQTLAQGTNGLIVAPGHPADVKPLIRRAARANIPVVCVATDAPGTERLASIAPDAFTSGAMAAELLTLTTASDAHALILTGEQTTADHAEKIEGFRSFLNQARPPLEIAAILETHDDPQQAYSLTTDFLAANRNIQAVYVSTANSVPVLEALKTVSLTRLVRVVTTDLFPALAPMIRDGRVLATLYQRPRTQGRLAFQALHQYLVQGRCPLLRQRMPPQLVLRSNLDVFLKMMPAEIPDTTLEAPTLPQTRGARGRD